MNKKFTFMVAALLAAGSMFAKNVTVNVGDLQAVKDAPKAYYYLTFGETNTKKVVKSTVDKATGSISFEEKEVNESKLTYDDEKETLDNYLWEVVVKDNKVTLKNKATGYYLAVNKSSKTPDFVSNVVEYTNGSELEKTFELVNGVLNYGDKKVSFSEAAKPQDFTLGDTGENLTLTKVENQDVLVSDLQKLGEGFTLSFTGNPTGADVFAGVTVVKADADSKTFYLVKGKAVLKDDSYLNENNTFVVLSAKSGITGVTAPNGYTYTTVKGDKLKSSNIDSKKGEFPEANATFKAHSNINQAGKYALEQPEVWTLTNDTWSKYVNNKSEAIPVWVAATGNTGAALVNAQTNSANAAWMSTNLGSAVSVKDLVKGKMLVNVLTTAGADYSSFDYILYATNEDATSATFTTAASELAGKKAYLNSQWYVSVGDDNTITLKNRETGAEIVDINLYTTAATGVYKAQGNKVEGKYLKFVNVEGATQYDGYVNLSKEDLEEAYKLKTVATVNDFDIDVVLEQSVEAPQNAAKYSGNAIYLKDKSDKEIQWKLAKATKKVEGADGKEVSVVDTVYQITKYKYYNADKLKEAADTLKVFKYNLTSANAVANEGKTILNSILKEGYEFANSKAQTPEAPQSVVLRKAGDKFVMAYAPDNNKLGEIKGFAAVTINDNNNVMSANDELKNALKFTMEPVATAAQYDVPETHFALEIGGAYLGANAKETGILTNDTTMLKSTEVDSSFSFYAFSADKEAAKRPSYYLSTNGKMMYNPADSISAIDKKIAALDEVFEADKIAALKAEKANYVNGDLSKNEALVKFQQAKYVNADSIYVAGKGINGDALKPFKFNVEEVDGQAVLKNGDKYVAVVNGVAVLRANDAAKFNVVDAATPTSNETVSASEVAVVAQNGSVVVKNAAGKNVVVSTILGQVVANEVLTSDNATINVPAGIVVVSVEGESFKVNVK